MTRPVTVLATLAVAFSALLWGCWWLPLRALADQGLAGDWASLAVYGLATAALLPFALRRAHRLRRASLLLLATGGLTGAMLATWNHALLTGEVVRVTLLFYLAPIWGTLLALLALDHKVGALRGLTILLGLIGAAVVLGFEGGLPVPRGEGEWMGLLSGVLFALGATCAHKLPSGLELEKTFLTFLGATLVSAVLIPLQPGGWRLPVQVDPLAWPLAFALAVGVIIPITALLLWGAGRLEPGRVSVLYICEVLAAAVSATALTDDPFTLRDGLGASLIAGAALLEGLDQMREHRRAQWADLV